MSSLSKDDGSSSSKSDPELNNHDKMTNSKKRRLDEVMPESSTSVSSTLEATAAIEPMAPIPPASTTTATSSSSTSTKAVPTCTTSTLYVSNLHQRISEPHLEKLFQRFGDVNRVHIIRKAIPLPIHGSGGGKNGNGNGNQGRNNSHTRKGMTRQKHGPKQQYNGYSFAFVELKSIQSACTAMEQLNGVSLLGKDLVVRPANGRSEHNDGGTEDGGNGDAAAALKDGREMKKQKHDVESRIDAVKRALLEKKRRIPSSKDDR